MEELCGNVVVVGYVFEFGFVYCFVCVVFGCESELGVFEGCGVVGDFVGGFFFEC